MILNTPSFASNHTANAETAWASGDIDTAYRLALKQFEAHSSGEAGTLLVKTLVLKGRYQQAETVFAKLDRQSRLSKDIYPFMMHAFTQLGQFDQAAALVKKSGQSEATQIWWQQRAEHPLGVQLKGLSIIPFSEQNPLAALMPAIEVLINGEPMLAHLDTGGAYLAMSPRLAESLDIQTIELGRGYANDQQTTIHSGLLDRLEIGEASMTNVPVVALPALSGVLKGQNIEDMIILGTNVLEHFLVTWDNHLGRLVISPRADSEARTKHFDLLTDPQQQIPFYYYPDHLMLASGAIENKPALLFIDTGLVTIDGHGNQPAAGMDQNTLAEFGFGDELEEGSFVYPDNEIKLGPLSESGLSIRVFGDQFARTWSGISVHGLLGHGFLKHYVWTLDFDQHLLFFTRMASTTEDQNPAPEISAESANEYIGDYQVAPGINLVISFSEGSLLLQAPGQQAVPIEQTNPDEFEIKAAGAVIVFERDGQGKVIALKLQQGSNITPAKKM